MSTPIGWASLWALSLCACRIETSGLGRDSDGGPVGATDAPSPPGDAPPPRDAPTDVTRPLDAGDAGADACPAVLGAPCAWTRRVRITFDNSAQDEDLAPFPVLVVLDDGRIDYAHTRDAGEDVRFLRDDLSEVLPHEIERWDESGQSFVWVRVPRIAARSTTDVMWLYFGAPAAAPAESPAEVWNPGFTLVWHLTATSDDSTGLGHGGALVGTSRVNGRIAGGRALERSSGDYIDSSYDEHLDTMTVEAWARASAAPASGRNVGVVGRNENYQLNWDHFGPYAGTFTLRIGGTWEYASFLPVVADQWHYVVGTYDGKTIRAYRDGALVSSNTAPAGPPDPDAFPLRAGVNPDPATGWFYDGRIDEVRVSRGARSNAWIAAQHLSMTDALATYGPIETLVP